MGLLFILCITCFGVVEAATPTGCTGDTSDSSVTHYLCDATAVGGSIAFSGFTDSEPQRLTLYKVATSISASLFNGFSGFTVNSLNEDYPATLQILCTGTLTVAAGTFADFGYMEDVRFKDCTTTLISSMFSGMGTLNHLSITGGTLTTIDAGTFTSLDIKPIASVQNPTGELVIRNVVLTPGTFPSGFFSPLTNVKRIYLEKLGLTTVDASWFTANTALVYLSLADNALTTLPSTVLDNLGGLVYLNLEGDPLDCTDSNTAWYYTYAQTNNITFDGAAVCATPADQQDKTLDVWASSLTIATDACNGEIGIVVGSNCINLYQLICYSLTFVCLVFGIIALVLVIYMRKSTLKAKQNNINRPKPQGKSKGKPKGKGRKDSNAWA